MTKEYSEMKSLALRKLNEGAVENWVVTKTTQLQWTVHRSSFEGINEDNILFPFWQ